MFSHKSPKIPNLLIAPHSLLKTMEVLGPSVHSSHCTSAPHQHNICHRAFQTSTPKSNAKFQTPKTTFENLHPLTLSSQKMHCTGRMGVWVGGAGILLSDVNMYLSNGW
jgi:hypothetical protein